MIQTAQVGIGIAGREGTGFWGLQSHRVMHLWGVSEIRGGGGSLLGSITRGTPTFWGSIFGGLTLNPQPSTLNPKP